MIAPSVRNFQPEILFNKLSTISTEDENFESYNEIIILKLCADFESYNEKYFITNSENIFIQSYTQKYYIVNYEIILNE